MSLKIAEGLRRDSTRSSSCRQGVVSLQGIVEYCSRAPWRLRRWYGQYSELYQVGPTVGTGV